MRAAQRVAADFLETSGPLISGARVFDKRSWNEKRAAGGSRENVWSSINRMWFTRRDKPLLGYIRVFPLTLAATYLSVINLTSGWMLRSRMAFFVYFVSVFAGIEIAHAVQTDCVDTVHDRSCPRALCRVISRR